LNGGSGQKEYKPPDLDAYDPKMYQDLPVSSEVKDIFIYLDINHRILFLKQN
jgi:hypothetical protein